VKEGVILAGGEGTRLGENRPYNKHLTLVYDKPMIEHTVEQMKALGVDHAHIVSSTSGVADMFRVYRDEINGLDVSYHEQYWPNGAAHALGQTALEGAFPVLCGDTYFDPPLEPSERPTLYWNEFEGAQNHSVYDPETNIIVEKPVRDIGKRAIVAYYYDERVYDVIKTLEPTERGELELIDIHNWYLEHGVELVQYEGFFSDMGTPEGLLRVANHLHKKAHPEVQKAEEAVSRFLGKANLRSVR